MINRNGLRGCFELHHSILIIVACRAMILQELFAKNELFDQS